MGKILGQASWLFFAQFLTRILGFFYTIFLAKNLGVLDFGLYSVALAYFSIVSAVADFGFNRYLILEVSVDKIKASTLLFSVGMLRVTITTILFAIFALGLYIIDPDKARVNLSLLAVIAVIPLSVSQTIDSIFVAFRKLEYSAISLSILTLSSCIVGIYFINQGFGSTGAILALIIGQIGFLFTQLIFAKRQNLSITGEIKTEILKKILRDSLPYGFLGILGLLYFKVDTLMLTYLKGNFDVGVYAVAYRFLEAIVFIPSALATAMLPVTANLVLNDSKKAYEFYIKGLKILLGLSVLIVVGYIEFLPILINLYLSEYYPAIGVIKVLSLTIPFMFMISVQGIMLLSHKRFFNALVCMSIFNLFFNIALNLVLISRYSFMGAAWATVISDIVGFSIFYIYLKKQFK